MLDRTMIIIFQLVQQYRPPVARFRLPVAMMTIGLLSACATSIKVTGQIPDPLVPQLPLTGQLTYSDEFKSYNYQEKEKKRSITNLEFGDAQVSLFDGIFSKLITLVDNDQQAVDLQISPELLDFQYTAPRETKLNLYEVWLKYRLKIVDNDDQEIADWVVKGYGKTPTALLKSPSIAFNAATNVALRDVGAQLAIGFSTQPAIEDLLKRRAKANSNIEATIEVEESVTEQTTDK